MGGGRFDAGPAFSYCYGRFGSLAAGAFTFTILRTWGKPVFTEPGRTYLGGELKVGLADWSIGLGPLKRLGGPGWLLSWSLGKGF